MGKILHDISAAWSRSRVFLLPSFPPLPRRSGGQRGLTGRLQLSVKDIIITDILYDFACLLLCTKCMISNECKREGRGITPSSGHRGSARFLAGVPQACSRGLIDAPLLSSTKNRRAIAANRFEIFRDLPAKAALLPASNLQAEHSCCQ